MFKIRLISKRWIYTQTNWSASIIFSLDWNFSSVDCLLLAFASFAKIICMDISLLCGSKMYCSRSHSCGFRSTSQATPMKLSQCSWSLQVVYLGFSLQLLIHTWNWERMATLVLNTLNVCADHVACALDVSQILHVPSVSKDMEPSSWFS